MSSVVQNVVFDCVDAYAQATFWSKVTGHPLREEDRPGDPEVIVPQPNGPALFFQVVPEPKTVKNRLHVGLRPDIACDAEVERLLGLGATLYADLRTPDGTGWVVLTDPEGNEFCVLQAGA